MKEEKKDVLRAPHLMRIKEQKVTERLKRTKRMKSEHYLDESPKGCTLPFVPVCKALKEEDQKAMTRIIGASLISFAK
ncbi:hypothetical protein H5410_030872 [Solanum commersonii]|uniref:Uncharacterized protein n=1 Tax=Solanum commersonii TaxID=4109 RepID=A0A9J5YKM1_SOLCO|nr:hypothetical protein H5410_030872 [Solanum commersonii]